VYGGAGKAQAGAFSAVTGRFRRKGPAHNPAAAGTKTAGGIEGRDFHITHHKKILVFYKALGYTKA
jgi:hypothetical protein